MKISARQVMVTAVALSVIGSGLALTGTGVAATRNKGLTIIALSDDGQLVRVKEKAGSEARLLGAITGFVGDTSLVGIDYRPATGQLYGVGNSGGIYTIDVQTRVATKVSQLSTALSGTSFGVDFNPTVDRLRIVSDTGQNLRHDVTMAAPTTTTDTSLTYPPATSTATGITGAAYTNNDVSTNTATTLFDLDSSLDQMAIQAPANNGLLSATGKTNMDCGSVTGLDIYTTVRDGVAIKNKAIAVCEATGASAPGIYAVNMTTGAATLRSSLPSSLSIVGIAIPPNQL